MRVRVQTFILRSDKCYDYEYDEGKRKNGNYDIGSLFGNVYSVVNIFSFLAHSLFPRKIFSHIYGARQKNYQALDYIQKILVYREEIKPYEDYL